MFIRNYGKEEVRWLSGVSLRGRLCKVFDAIRYFQDGGPCKSTKEENFKPSD
jgi:hypothetical protein